MNNFARGYIASGAFNGYRVPQHLQNQIIRTYCVSHDLVFVLSRAEYWIDGSTMCQLWAALKEGYKNIVFFSVWQLPDKQEERWRIYRYCLSNQITLHFATEQMSMWPDETCREDFELLIKTHLMMGEGTVYSSYIQGLKDLL